MTSPEDCKRVADAPMESVCDKCLSDVAAAGSVAMRRKAEVERRLSRMYSICRQCTHAPSPSAGDACDSLDCPVFYERSRCTDKLEGDIEDLMSSIFAARGDA
jgi:hypothetical protein